MPLKKRLLLFVLLIAYFDRSRSFNAREMVWSRLKAASVDVSDLKNWTFFTKKTGKSGQRRDN